MRLVEEPRPQDLETVVYWVRDNGRAWPVNEDNVPVRTDGSPFVINYESETDLPVIEEAVTKLTILDGEAVEVSLHDDVGPVDGTTPEEIPERLVFKLRMLLGRDDSEITQVMVKTRTRTVGRRRNRRPEVETEMDLSAARSLKLQKAIVEWEGVTDKNDKPAEINAENINLLPGWLLSDLIDRVDEMSGISEEEAGE